MVLSAMRWASAIKRGVFDLKHFQRIPNHEIWGDGLNEFCKRVRYKSENILSKAFIFVVQKRYERAEKLRLKMVTKITQIAQRSFTYQCIIFPSVDIPLLNAFTLIYWIFPKLLFTAWFA